METYNKLRFSLIQFCGKLEWKTQSVQADHSQQQHSGKDRWLRFCK